MTIAAIEDAIVARLQAVLGTKVRGVQSLPGDWDDDTLRRLLRLVPGAFVAFAGGGVPRPGAAVAEIDGRWIVYVITAHASGEAARRRGDAQQAGAYELLEVVVPALHAHTIADEGSLMFQQVENLYTGTVDRQGIAVYAATFSLPMALPSTLNLAVLDPFVTFDAQYDVPPHTTEAEHQKWLDGDYSTTRPDAQDRVTLPQT